MLLVQHGLTCRDDLQVAVVEYLPSPSARRVAPSINDDMKKKAVAAAVKKEGGGRGRKKVRGRYNISARKSNGFSPSQCLGGKAHVGLRYNL